MKIHLIAGARPNFMKIAPLYHTLKSEIWAKTYIIHTGQHYDLNMSDVFFRDLRIPEPDLHLGGNGATHGEQTGKVIIEYEKVLLTRRPDLVIVVGDVNSTMAVTLAAAKLGIKVAHVEAGLRSFDRTMPEEINRIVTDSIADILYTPSLDANENLRREGIQETRTFFVGNIMIDTLVANLDKARKKRTHLQMGFREKDFAYVTLHRPSNVDDQSQLRKIINNLEKLSSILPVCFPVHPRTKRQLLSIGIEVRGKNNALRITDPLSYYDSICLAENARFVLTDSGGLQEETTYLGTPCLTLRPNTERPITITKGSNKLTSPNALWLDVKNILNGPQRIGSIPELWDGHTAERIVRHLKSLS